jgi:hypothetical protein
MIQDEWGINARAEALSVSGPRSEELAMVLSGLNSQIDAIGLDAIGLISS